MRKGVKTMAYYSKISSGKLIKRLSGSTEEHNG